MSPIPVAQSCSLPSGSLRVRANASRAVLDAWDYVLIFAASALALLVVVNVLVFWLVSQALKPFARIVQGLNQLQAGRFDIALPMLAWGRGRSYWRCV